MEQSNLKTLAVTVPSAVPVSYHDLPPRSSDTHVLEAIQAQQPEPFPIPDPTEPLIENVTKPLLAFFDAPETDTSRSMPDGGSVKSSSDGRFSQATTEVPESEAEVLVTKKQGTVARVHSFLPCCSLFTCRRILRTFRMRCLPEEWRSRTRMVEM
jgi:hypothetical protein